MSPCSAAKSSELRDGGPPDPCTSIYVHIPFCRDRCTYCSFPTVLDRAQDHAPLVSSMLLELARLARIGPLRTLYLGGGTPSLLSSALIHKLLESARNRFGFLPGAEISLETNPGQVNADSLKSWAESGVTRLSVGIETFDAALLRYLGRHDSTTIARSALELIATRWAGTWSADLIVGWGSKGLEDLERDIASILCFKPPHISVYGLTLEPGTALFEKHRTTQAELAPPDALADLDGRWSELLSSAGHVRYEVSNWALPGHASRHNQVYWRNEAYLGIGPGAASSMGNLRWVNHSNPQAYTAALQASRSVRDRVERLTPVQRLIESLAIGLRTRQGVALAELDRRFGPDWRTCVGSQLGALVQGGVMTEDAQYLAIAHEHFTRADSVIGVLTRDLCGMCRRRTRTKSVQSAGR